MNIINKIITYLKECREELKKVIWPDKKTTTNHTMLVIGVSLGVAAFLGAVDFIFTYFLNIIIK